MYADEETYNAACKGFIEKTGYDCAKWLVEYCIEKDLDLPTYYIHSMNPAGGNNIKKFLDRYKKFRETEKL
jgi:hypothetical protein